MTTTDRAGPVQNWASSGLLHGSKIYGFVHPSLLSSSLAESWVGGEAAGTGTSSHMGCWHRRWKIRLLPHCVGPQPIEFQFNVERRWKLATVSKLCNTNFRIRIFCSLKDFSLYCWWLLLLKLLVIHKIKLAFSWELKKSMLFFYNSSWSLNDGSKPLLCRMYEWMKWKWLCGFKSRKV